MPGAMRKMAVYLGLVEDEDERYEVDGDDSDERERPRAAAEDRIPGPVRSGSVRRLDEPRSAGGLATAVRPAEPAVKVERTPQRITTLHPRTYNEARTIGEHFREGTPVIMNLSEMDDSDAKRLVDFAAGLIFGLRGSIERVTAKVFLLSPANVQITAEDKQRIAEGGFFNQS
ncbi:MAG: cell division protein SepF [Frankiaceae bacterium]|jgi:cell division inhibitor SepF